MSKRITDIMCGFYFSLYITSILLSIPRFVSADNWQIVLADNHPEQRKIGEFCRLLKNKYCVSGAYCYSNFGFGDADTSQCKCPAGTYNNEGSSCIACPVDTFSDSFEYHVAGIDVCKRCPDGLTTNGKTGQIGTSSCTCKPNENNGENSVILTANNQCASVKSLCSSNSNLRVILDNGVCISNRASRQLDNSRSILFASNEMMVSPDNKKLLIIGEKNGGLVLQLFQNNVMSNGFYSRAKLLWSSDNTNVEFTSGNVLGGHLFFYYGKLTLIQYGRDIVWTLNMPMFQSPKLLLENVQLVITDANYNYKLLFLDEAEGATILMGAFNAVVSLFSFFGRKNG